MYPRLSWGGRSSQIGMMMLSWMFVAYCHEFCCDCECYVLVICQSKIKFQCHELYQNTKID